MSKCSLRTCWQTEKLTGSRPDNNRLNSKRKKTLNKKRERRSRRNKINQARAVDTKTTVVVIVNITIDKVDVDAEIVITKTI